MKPCAATNSTYSPGHKPKTINRRLAALAAYAHWLEQAGYVKNARNPVQGVRRSRRLPVAQVAG